MPHIEKVHAKIGIRWEWNYKVTPDVAIETWALGHKPSALCTKPLLHNISSYMEHPYHRMSVIWIDVRHPDSSQRKLVTHWIPHVYGTQIVSLWICTRASNFQCSEMGLFCRLQGTEVIRFYFGNRLNASFGRCAESTNYLLCLIVLRDLVILFWWTSYKLEACWSRRS